MMPDAEASWAAALPLHTKFGSTAMRTPGFSEGREKRRLSEERLKQIFNEIYDRNKFFNSVSLDEVKAIVIAACAEQAKEECSEMSGPRSIANYIAVLTANCS